MRLWARNRAAYLTIIVSIVSAVFCVPGSTILVALPNLTGGPGFAAPLSALLPLAPVLALTSGLSRQNTPLETVAIRRVWWADIALAVGCLVPFAVLALIQPADVMLEAFRNAMGYLGTALTVTWLFGLSVAPIAPVVWAIAAAMGLLPLGEHLFNWPMAPAPASLSWVGPTLLTLAGIATYQHHHRPVVNLGRNR